MLSTDPWGQPGWGWELPSSWVPDFLSTKQSTTDMATAAGAQVAKAGTGSRLASYTAANTPQLFWSTAANDIGAYYKTAYWLAVAARVSGVGALAALAAKHMGQGNALNTLPGGSLKTGGVSSIYAKAASYVDRYMLSSASKSAILKGLNYMGQPDTIERHRQNEFDKGPGTTVVAPTIETARDVVSLLPFGPDANDPRTRWIKIALYVVGGLVVVGGLLYLSRPHAEALRERERQRQRREAIRSDQW